MIIKRLINRLKSFTKTEKYKLRIRLYEHILEIDEIPETQKNILEAFNDYLFLIFKSRKDIIEAQNDCDIRTAWDLSVWDNFFYLKDSMFDIETQYIQNLIERNHNHYYTLSEKERESHVKDLLDDLMISGFTAITEDMPLYKSLRDILYKALFQSLIITSKSQESRLVLIKESSPLLSQLFSNTEEEFKEKLKTVDVFDHIEDISLSQIWENTCQKEACDFVRDVVKREIKRLKIKVGET